MEEIKLVLTGKNEGSCETIYKDKILEKVEEIIEEKKITKIEIIYK